MSFEFKKPEIQMPLEKEEFDLLDEKETSIGEDISNLKKGMGQAVAIGGASFEAKKSAFKKSYFQEKSENYLLPKEERDIAFTKYKKNEVAEKEWKEAWGENRKSVEETYEEINNVLFKGAYKITTGMLGDYADATNLNLMIGMNALTQGIGGGMYGASKTTLLYIDMLLGGLEEGSLNYQTQKFMQEKQEVDYTEVGLSAVYGTIGETLFPMLGSAMGMGYGKVVNRLGGETFEEISSKLIKQASDKAKMDLIKSKVQNEVKYGKGNYDNLIVRDASKIDSSIDEVGTITGNLRRQGDSVVTVNNKSLSELEGTDQIAKELQEMTGGKTLEDDLKILKSMKEPIKKIEEPKKMSTSYDLENKQGGYQEILKDPEYFAENKNQKLNKVVMTPDEYLEESAKGFGISKEELLKSRNIELAKKYAKDMEKGDNFPLLSLDYSKNKFTQEGIHRAMASKMRNEQTIPVMIIEKVSKEKGKTNLEAPVGYKNLSDVEDFNTANIAVNDIGVDNAKATNEMFTPKPLEKESNFIGGVVETSDYIKEIRQETEIFNTKTREVTDAINDVSEIGELKAENIDKINDYIEEYELEETIPLLKKRADGTIDFGKKTKDDFINDFKIELQLFSDPIDKTTPEAIFKNVTLREATKMVNNSKEILGNVLKKSKEKLGRPLKLTERSKIIRNFIKENLYNSYRYSQNKNMTRLHFNTVFDYEGNRYGAKEIFNLMDTDGDTGFLGKALFDPKLETKTKGTGLAMNKFIKRWENSIKLFVDGNFKTDFDNVKNSLLFDSQKLYYDSLDEATAIRVTNKNNELDFDTMSIEERAELEVFAFDMFEKKNADLFDKKTARIVWDNFVGKGKSASQLEGTVLHQMGDLQRFYDEKIIDKATLKKLVERYRVSDRKLYNRMVKTSSNSNALYSTFGYKPSNTLNRMFGNYSKSNPLSTKSAWLFGEGKQAWTLKQNTNEYAGMIFDDEIGRTLGAIQLKSDRFFNYKARMDSIMLGMTELPVEIATHMAKRLAVGKEPIHKILFQTVKSVMEVHSLTKKIENETTDTFLRENIGALGSLYEFMITKGETDYSGAITDTLKSMTPKQRAIFKADQGISKLNFIRQTDLYGDKLALFGTNYDLNKFGKIGYKKIMGNSKYNYIASKLDEFGIGEDTFNMMVNSKRGEFGIRDYGQYTKKELELHGGTANIELKKMQDFTSFYTSKIGFTKPDVEFAKAKNVFRTEDDKFLTALNMYWKKTMYTKLKDGASLVGTMNTYAGLGKTFDWLNVDHYTRLLMGATAIGLGGYGSNKMDELVYGYELEEAENLTDQIMLIFNQFGAYTLTDQTSLMRSLGQVLNGKTAKTKAKGAVKLVAPSKVIRQVERLTEEEEF